MQRHFPDRKTGLRPEKNSFPVQRFSLCHKVSRHLRPEDRMICKTSAIRKFCFPCLQFHTFDTKKCNRDNRNCYIKKTFGKKLVFWSGTSGTPVFMRVLLRPEAKKYPVRSWSFRSGTGPVFTVLGHSRVKMLHSDKFLLPFLTKV